MSDTEPKRRPGRPPIPRERIIDAALELVDEQGDEALTFRALAERLSSSTATLYRHFESRTDLVGHVIDRILADADLPDSRHGDVGWEQICHDTAVAVFATLTTHRRASLLLIEDFPTGRHALALRERLLTTLLDAGFDQDTAARAVATIARFTLGMAMQSDAAQPTSSQLTTRIPADDYPNLAATAHLMPRRPDDEFSFGLTMILIGLKASLPPHLTR